ncbi:hypothetical protein COO60DRAFT_554841 [Scenedesmus sp. NREL 46B-D3]|nr:hypothetical protein COO60DRAFT_554841 [Scenedesmus sp. NREL 46B-D3]
MWQQGCLRVASLPACMFAIAHILRQRCTDCRLQRCVCCRENTCCAGRIAATAAWSGGLVEIGLQQFCSTLYSAMLATSSLATRKAAWKHDCCVVSVVVLVAAECNLSVGRAGSWRYSGRLYSLSALWRRAMCSVGAAAIGHGLLRFMHAAAGWGLVRCKYCPAAVITASWRGTLSCLVRMLCSAWPGELCVVKYWSLRLLLCYYVVCCAYMHAVLCLVQAC